MTINLRPLSLGEIFDRIAELYRKNFVLFAGLSTVYAGAIMILGLLRICITFALNGGSTSIVKTGLFGLFFFVELSAILVLAGMSVAAICRAVAWVNLGEPATIVGAYKSILPKAGRYVWLMILTGFFVFLWTLLFGVVIGIGAGIAAFATRGGGAGLGILGGLIVFVGAVVAVVFVIWISIRYSLAVPSCVVEDLKAGAAIKRSIELTKGSRGRIFVLFLLIMVIAVAIVGVTQFAILIAAFKHPGQPLPLGTQVLQQVLSFVTSTLIGPIGSIGVTLFYYDQRIRKEGFDIEWMMQAAGLTALSAGASESLPSVADGSETAQA